MTRFQPLHAALARCGLALCGSAVVLFASTAQAASLDNLEVGGAWGTPGATDGTAIWWNPAGLAAGEGTRVTIEGAPTFAVIDIERAEPNGGPDRLTLQGVVPFAGVATDFGVPGLGVGLGLAAPYTRGGAQTPEGGPVRYHLREGHTQIAAIMGGVGYELEELVALGVGLQVMSATWDAKVDNELMPDLADEIGELGQDAGYTDADLEDPDYAATVQFDELRGMAVTMSAGLRVQPVEEVAVALTWMKGFHVDHEGEVTLDFSCPPQEDTLGRFGAESKGVCDTSIVGAAAVGFDMPGRLHGGVIFTPTPAVRIEGMAGMVFWSAHKDYAIVIDEIAARNPEVEEETVELVERNQLWARDNVDAVWLGIDVKGTIDERVTLGGRVLYDQSAIPDAVLIANNYDTNTVILGGLVAGKVIEQLELGLSWSHYFLSERTIEDSAFSMSVDPALRKEDRFNYPHGNGTYGGSIDRLGISARLAL